MKLYIRQEKITVHQMGKALLTICILCILALAFQAANALVFNSKLSGTMPEFGDVDSFKVSPDGNYIVYVANQSCFGNRR